MEFKFNLDNDKIATIAGGSVTLATVVQMLQPFIPGLNVVPLPVLQGIYALGIGILGWITNKKDTTPKV